MGDRAGRSRVARYDLYTLAVLELLLAVTLMAFLIASDSHLYGIAAIHVVSITFAFALPAMIASGVSASVAPAFFIPSVLADMLLIFSLVVGFVSCIDGRASHRFELALDANVCQGSTADSGFVEGLLAVIAGSLLVTTLQEVFASVRLSGNHEPIATRNSLEVIRCTLLFFVTLWFWVRGAYVNACVVTTSFATAIVDVSIRWRWASVLSLAMGLPLLVLSPLHSSWLCPTTAWLCPYDTAVSAVVMLIIGVICTAIGTYSCVHTFAEARERTSRRYRLHPKTPVFTMAAHLVGSIATIAILHVTGNHLAAALCWISATLHTLGSLLIMSFDMNTRNVDVLYAGISMGAVALLLDVAYAAGALAAVNKACILNALRVFSACIGPGEASAVAALAVLMISTCAVTIAKAVELNS
jgi:hypothetical protein